MSAEPALAGTPYRIKDLVLKTGITKETIHFYILEGLLPKARKTARNMAWYGDEHVERLKTIKDLQEKQFLPLKAIKAVLCNTRDHEFTREQKRTITAIQSRLAPRESSSEKRWLSFRELSSRCGVKLREIDELEAAGVITVDRGGRSPRVDAADEVIVKGWVEARELGFAPERGFGPRDLEMYENAISDLFDEEVKMFTSRVEALDPDEAARLVEHAVPKINELLVQLHLRKLRQFLSLYKAQS